jgi:hypothetical protein
MNKLWVVRLVLVIVIGLLITAFFISRSLVPTVQGAFEIAGEKSWLGTVGSAVYGFLITLVGVFIGAAYRRLIELRGKGTTAVSLPAVTTDVVRSIDFHIGLVGSPLVFGLIWQSIGDISVAGITMIALQNGFTSHAVLERVVPHGQDATPPNKGMEPTP